MSFVTLSTLITVSWIIHLLGTTNDENAADDAARMNSLIEIISLLEEHLDHLSLKVKLSEALILDRVSLHHGCFKFFNRTYDVDESVLYSFPSDKEGNKTPWLSLLSQFRHASLEKLNISAEELKRTTEEQKNLIIDSNRIEFVSRLISKGCYGLSNTSLKVQVSSCASVTAGFQFLAYVSCNYEVSPMLRCLLLLFLCL